MPQPLFEVALSQDRPIPARALRALYDTAGWWPERDEAALTRLLAHSLAVGAWRHDDLIGFARAFGDGHFRAVIEDVIVHPRYRRLGIGSLLVATLREALHNVDTITLVCTPELMPFYAREGFQVLPHYVLMECRPPRS